MTNHPNRGRRKPSDNPPPELIRAARDELGHTNPEMAASLAPTSISAVERWMAGRDVSNHRPMHPQLFSRYLAKNGLIEAGQDWTDWER